MTLLKIRLLANFHVWFFQANINTHIHIYTHTYTHTNMAEEIEITSYLFVDMPLPKNQCLALCCVILAVISICAM